MELFLRDIYLEKCENEKIFAIEVSLNGKSFVGNVVVEN